MLISRLKAFVIVFSMIACCSSLCILLVHHVGIFVTRGYSNAHAQSSNGIIVDFNEKKQELILQKADGQRETYACRQRCLQNRAHILRHMKEQAATDVYYIPDSPKTPLAVNVD